MKATPPIKTESDNNLELAKNEVMEALHKKRTKSFDHPWKDPDIQDESVSFTTRISKPLHEKLKFISSHTGMKMTTMLNRLIDPWADQKLRDIFSE